jgi:hypothetical protein
MKVNAMFAGKATKRRPFGKSSVQQNAGSGTTPKSTGRRSTSEKDTFQMKIFNFVVAPGKDQDFFLTTGKKKA